jgi:ABC-type multidrug transport system fused ATPase/permease subunit
MNLPEKIFPFIFYFVRKQWIKIFIAIVAAASWGIYSALFPYFLKSLINVLGSSALTVSQIQAASIKIAVLIVGLWIAPHSSALSYINIQPAGRPLYRMPKAAPKGRASRAWASRTPASYSLII